MGCIKKLVLLGLSVAFIGLCHASGMVKLKQFGMCMAPVRIEYKAPGVDLTKKTSSYTEFFNIYEIDSHVKYYVDLQKTLGKDVSRTLADIVRSVSTEIKACMDKGKYKATEVQSYISDKLPALSKEFPWLVDPNQAAEWDQKAPFATEINKLPN